MRDRWRETTLREVATRTIGRTPPRNDPSMWATSTERPFVTIADLGLNRTVTAREGVSELAEASGHAKRFPAGSLLLSFKLSIGRVGVADRDVFTNEAIARLAPVDGVLRDFLAIALENVNWEELGGRAVKGKTMNKSSLDAVDDAVDAAEAEVRETEALVEATRDLRIWSADVGLTPLSKVARVVGCLVAPVGDAAMLPHIGTDRIESVTGRLVGVQTAAEDQVTSGKFLHESDTVIYSKIRPNLRKVAIPSWRGLCSADAYPMLPMGEGNISFLRHLLVSRPFTDAAVARSGRTKMPKINRTELMSIEVPDIEPDEQASIAADLDSMRDAAGAARATAESLRTLRSNLLTVLLSGEHEIPASYDALLGEVA